MKRRRLGAPRPARDAVWYFGSQSCAEEDAKCAILDSIRNEIAVLDLPHISDLSQVPYRSRTAFTADAILGRLIVFSPARAGDPWPGEEYVRDGLVVGWAAVRYGDVYVAHLVLRTDVPHPTMDGPYVIPNGTATEDVL